MIAASSVETEGNNKPFFPPQVLPKDVFKNISLMFHRHEFKNGENETRMKENLCKFTI